MNNKNLNLKLNAIGRFSMSNWSNKKITVGHTSENSKLANWIEIKNFGIHQIKRYFKKNFTRNEIKKMSILDVGCADGYLIENLAKLGFKKNIGIEPRKSSISRGKNIRKILGIKDKANYYTLSIENLNKKFKTDIITCFGVLHHTSNVYKNLSRLLRCAKKQLILEGEFIPQTLYKNKKFSNQGQLKDLLYDKEFSDNNFIESKYGITLHKYESSYYDGLTKTTGIVDIPSIDSVRMHANILGYESQIVASKNFKNKLNSFRAIIVFKKNKKKRLSDEKIYSNFETKFFSTVLPIEILKKFKSMKEFKKLNFKNDHKYHHIIKNLKFNFKDKINLEFSKYYIFKMSQFKKGKIFLDKIIYKRNVDWFSCYRSFYLLFLIDQKKRVFWKKMLLSCHPSFPNTLLKKKLSFFF